MVSGVQAKVEFIVGQREIELLLRLRHRVGIGGRQLSADRLGDIQVFRQLVDLCFVQVSDRFKIRRSVAQFHEESLIVFQPIGCAHDGVVQAIGPVVFQHFADALLEVAGGDDGQVSVMGQAGFVDLTVRGLNDDGEDAQLIVVCEFGQRDLTFVSGSVIRESRCGSLHHAAGSSRPRPGSGVMSCSML